MSKLPAVGYARIALRCLVFRHPKHSMGEINRKIRVVSMMMRLPMMNRLNIDIAAAACFHGPVQALSFIAGFAV